MPTTRQIQPKDVKILWGLAAGRCAFPDCRRVCVEAGTQSDPTVAIGEMAHIVAHGKSGPRADPSYAGTLNGYGNLLLLCPTHHSIVDKQPNSYTVEMLRGWKASHEQWVREQTEAEIPQIGFAELEMVSHYLKVAPGAGTGVAVPTPPREKMRRNDLSDRVHSDLLMGLAVFPLVESYVTTQEKLDPDFPNRLTAAFGTQYEKLRQQRFTGDALFFALADWAAGPGKSMRLHTAGLAVLAYLFIKCEVFEP